MPRGKQGGKTGSEAKPSRKSSRNIAPKTDKQPRNVLSAASAPRLHIKTETRSRRSTTTYRPSPERRSRRPTTARHPSPERIIREGRKLERERLQALVQERLDSPTGDQLYRVAQTLEAHLTGHQGIDYGVSEEHPDERTPPLSEETDPEQSFNGRWGYLPPLSGEAVAIINAIIAHPEMAKEQARIGPESKEFPEGLRFRNVLWMESSDPYAAHINDLELKDSSLETEEERRSHEHLWNLDRTKCNGASNEALFQRTIMMNLISRHSIIHYKDDNNQVCLDFSVEEVWNCPPMPTRAYSMGGKFLTQPKPDLAICFRREVLIPNHMWFTIPRATGRLACFENPSEVGETRAFPFFTIEAKKAESSSDDTVGKRQGLNNASQALHNMFEFFRDADADADTHHEDIFFEKVRFFSVGASTEGLTVRIHRAVRDPGDKTGLGFIMKNRPDYPLRFEHQNFAHIPKTNFDRETVFKIFETILIGYGVNELCGLLASAAQALMDKLNNDDEAKEARQDPEFYRYGQTKVPGSKKNTPSLSRAQSVPSNMGPPSRSFTNMSVDMMRSGSTTPMQKQAQKGVKKSNKRSATQLENSRSRRKTGG
ncbi:hypothetical protein MMC11_002458 [Xylographa trunciseda]|nr:hypothetical protein [Xylographa trunciseda]